MASADGNRAPRDLRIVRPAHRGRTFDVYEAVLRGRPVAMKVPAAAPGADDAFTAVRAVGSISTVWNVDCAAGEHRAGTADAPPATAEDLLTDEFRRLAAIGRRWNHGDPEFLQCRLGDRGTLPALITSWHPGSTLAAMSRPSQRGLLPRMMLALWDALAAGTHGDLQPSNVVVAPARDRFALIDPGAMVRRRETDPTGPVTSSDSLVFVTNARHYPLLPPYARTLPLATRSGPREHWEAFVESVVAASGAGCTRAADEAQPPADARHAFPDPSAPPRGEPHPADLLAVGILYYEALTGTHPFAGADAGVPAWAALGARDGCVRRGDAAETLLATPVAPPSARDPAVRPEEDALAVALLTLDVGSRDRLMALGSAASIAANF
jgi:hypothetical protein